MNSESQSPPSASALLISLLPAWLAMAWLVSKAQWFWNNRPDLQFGWVVLLLCAYLFWEAWETRPASRMRPSLWGILLGVLALGLLLVVQMYQAAFGTTAATVQGLALGALTLVAANLSFIFGPAGVRHFAMSFAFILLALPLPSVLYEPIVLGLQRKVASVDVQVLNLLGVPAHQVGSLIQLPSCTVGIDEACSGIRSLQSTLMATLFIGYLTLKRLGPRLMLLVTGLGLAVFGNVIRSLFLSLVANRRGVEALHKFHDSAGWSILAFTVVGVGLLAWGLARLEKQLALYAAESASSPPATMSDPPA